MNQRGNVVFVGSVTAGGQSVSGTFRWDAQARQVTAVAMKGLPATDGRSFEEGRGEGRESSATTHGCAPVTASC